MDLGQPRQTSSLRVAQWVPDTVSEGPGRRFAVWVQGCPLGCPGCCNPEMLSPEGGERWTVDRLARKILATPGIEGLTLAGGEPFFQAAACAELCERVRAGGLGVMIFSGYTLAELAAPGADPAWGRLLARADLLVDGRYEREQPETRRRWIGSRNQQLHFLSDRYSPDDPVFTGANTVELRLVGGSLSINGWPARVL
jgi:anaerobic ribonucleoside-triphosphate reductase activating protein